MSKALSTIFDALRSQVTDEIGHETDMIVLYDGTLDQAMADHLGQRLDGFKHGSFVFFGFSEEVPDELSGAGTSIRNQLTVDFFVVVRAKGRSRYKEDLERLYYLSDKMVHEVFLPCDTDGWVDSMKTNLAATRFVLRRRQDTGDSLFAHLIRFHVIPRQ